MRVNAVSKTSKAASISNTSRLSYQSSLGSFLPSILSSEQGDLPFDVDELAEKIATKVAQKLSGNPKSAQSTSSTTTYNPTSSTALRSSNLIELVDEVEDFEILKEENSWVLQCRTCVEFLNSSRVSFSSSFNRPTGKADGSLASGLHMSDALYEQLIAGKCEKWYSQKQACHRHLLSLTHKNADDHMKMVKQGRSREVLVAKNQLRAALGVVKTKSAAVHYEARIAELQAAGADVGDFCHSRKLFPDMIKAACAYIDMRAANFLSTPLPNTGMPPHFYVTADKSTNHRITNQVTIVCPVVNGSRRGIVLDAREVYSNSDATGGTGDALAASIFKDLDVHVGIKDNRLLQVQGRVMDGQYVNEPFIAGMNEPVFELLHDDLSCKERFWWPVQWDPAHWLDKVFSQLKDSPFVDRLLRRIALYHQLFSRGKMHSVARHTAKDLNLPFRVTNAFAHQRFLSSSYLSLKNLADSLEVYIETFKDHDNREEMGYKLCGQDFVHDLLGVLDLLWPLVVLMLQAQAEWYPGWKLCSHVPLVKRQMQRYIEEVSKIDPDDFVCPRLSQRVHEIRDYRFGQSELETGWFVVREGDGKVPVDWVAREMQDSVHDLEKLAADVISQIDVRYTNSFSDLNRMLSKCFDFGRLFRGLCGFRSEEKSPVNNREFSELGANEFRRCVNFSSQMPHVSEKNFELCSELSSTVFWRLKKTLIAVVWGDMLHTHFPNFFKKISLDDEGIFSLQDVVFEEGVFVTRFQEGTPRQFTLSEVFEVTLNNGKMIDVLFKEEAVIESLYNDSSFYSAVGQEFCLVFDIFYAKCGTEAVAESFYRVVDKQEMDGGQSIKVLMNRAKVDWSLPSVLQCDAALNEMAKLYINGDKERGLSRHMIPVFRDRRAWQKHEGEMSKVLQRIITSRPKLPFLL